MEKKNYIIKYDLGGGKNHKDNPLKYTITTKTIKLKNPSRKGYQFSGWYSDKKYEKKINEIKKGTTGNKTIYANWTAIKYTIIFDGNGNTGGKMKKLSGCKYGKSYVLTSNAFNKKYYTFIGWNTKKDGSGKTYSNKEKVKSLTTKANGKVTLYAQWKKTEYKIEYIIGDDVTNHKDNPVSYTYSKTKEIILKNPKRRGYLFKGWYTDSKYKKKIEKIKPESSGKITLYPRWKAISYTIIFDGNGTTGGEMQRLEDCKYDKKITLSQNKFENGNRKFIGWNTAADGSGIEFADGAVVKNLTSQEGGIVTLYAQWKSSNESMAATALSETNEDWEIYQGVYAIEVGGKNNKYNETFGASGTDWCAYFVMWCAKQNQIPNDVIPQNNNCAKVQTLYNIMIHDCNAVVTMEPQAGDLVFYDLGTGHAHVGIMTDNVISVQGNVFYNNRSYLQKLNNVKLYLYSDSITYVRPNY